jgi:hypothetical protein
VNLHTAVAHRVVVGSAVGVVAPIVVVTHTVEAVAAVHLVIMVAGSMVAVAVHRMTTLAGSGHCPSVLPPGLRAVLLPIVIHSIRCSLSPLYLNEREAEFFGYAMPSLDSREDCTTSFVPASHLVHFSEHIVNTYKHTQGVWTYYHKVGTVSENDSKYSIISIQTASRLGLTAETPIPRPSKAVGNTLRAIFKLPLTSALIRRLPDA